jgi:hypothetical protein
MFHFATRERTIDAILSMKNTYPIRRSCLKMPLMKGLAHMTSDYTDGL